jgi:uncharacterized SAM-binding protein YcdF (DUF218 family)
MKSYLVDIVVLGRRLDEGGRVSEIFRRRLEKAAEVYLEKKGEGAEARVIITGGDLGRLGVTEALAGWSYLKARGRVDPADMALEEKALDTVSNAVHAKLLILAGGSRRPAIVSSSYHIPRASYIFSHVLGPDFEPTFVSASTGLGREDYRRHWRSESVKMVEAVKFLDDIEAEPGDHDKVLAYLRIKGLVVEDKVI